jgi:hypothetical protein
MMKEHSLKIIENKVLNWTLGCQREQVTRERRKLRNEEYNGLYSSASVVTVTNSRGWDWWGK